MTHRPARWPYILLLGLIAVLYFAFHAVRDSLDDGFLRESFPSLLALPAMFAVAELSPGIRFRSRRVKYSVLAITTLAAIVWLEFIVPHFTRRATGDMGDAIGLALGFAGFCLYDLCVRIRYGD